MLIEAIKDGSPDLKIFPPLFVYNENNEYTQKLERFYMENHKHYFYVLTVRMEAYMQDIQIILNAGLSFIMKEKGQNIQGAEVQ